MPAFSSFWKVLTKRPRFRGLSLQVPWNWQFWCGKDSQGYSGKASTPILRHTSSWTKGDSITWGRGWDDFLRDLLLGLELFLRRSRTHFCGREWVARHLLTFPTDPYRGWWPCPSYSYLGSHSSCLRCL